METGTEIRNDQVVADAIVGLIKILIKENKLNVLLEKLPLQVKAEFFFDAINQNTIDKDKQLGQYEDILEHLITVLGTERIIFLLLRHVKISRILYVLSSFIEE